MFSSSAQAISRSVTTREAKAEAFIAVRVSYCRCVSRSLEESPIGGFGEEDEWLSAGERVEIGYAIVFRNALILIIKDIQRLVHTLISGDTFNCVTCTQVGCADSYASANYLLLVNPVFSSHFKNLIQLTIMKLMPLHH